MIISTTTLDCRSLDKFDSIQTPCPILARLARPLELQCILSKKMLASFIIIKLDQANQEMSIHKILLKKMRTLIVAGFGKKNIKICRPTNLLNACYLFTPKVETKPTNLTGGSPKPCDIISIVLIPLEDMPSVTQLLIT